MIAPQECPLPVALPLARFLGATALPERIRHGADAAHALIKYVALVRLADWLEAGLPGGDEATIAAVDFVLGAPSAIHWWAVAAALEELPARPSAPRSPGWRARRAEIETAARARKFRHAGARPRADRNLAAEISNALETLAEAAEPLLRLPLVRSADGTEQPLIGTELPESTGARWRILVRAPGGALTLDPFALALGPQDEHARQDLFVYERMAGSAVFYERDDQLISLEERPASLERLVGLVRRRRAEEAGAALMRKAGRDATGEGLAQFLREAALEQARREISFLPIAHVERPEVAEALSALGDSGTRAVALSGPSGIGKTRELAEWVRRCAASGRVPLWVRSASWRGERVSELCGKALTGYALSLQPERIAQAVAGHGLAIAIDGANEAERPERMLESLVRDLGELDLPSVQIVVGVRPEALRTIRAALPPEWWAAPARFPDGVVRIEPLPIESARMLWRQAELGGAPAFDQLPPATRRLLQVPLMAALGIQAGVLGTSPRVEAHQLIERFVDLQTTDVERVVLRRLAAAMYGRRTQTLDAAALLQDEGLRHVEDEFDVVAPALARLADCGLLRVTGTLQASQELRVTFAHDRLLQWLVGRWLEHRAVAAGDVRAGPDGEGWGSALSDVAGSPALASGVGQAIAALEPKSPGLVFDLLASSNAETRAAGRLAARALAESDFRAAEAWRTASWHRVERDPVLRREIAALAADAGDHRVLAEALQDRLLRTSTTAALSRLRRYAPETVHETLDAVWSRARRRPWLHLPTTVVTARALLQALIAEGASPEGDEVLDRLLREISAGLLGRPGGVVRPLLRNAVVEGLAWVVPGALSTMPANWIDSRSELPRFFRRSKNDRARLRPLVDLFAGDASPADVAAIAIEVAKESDAVASTILERALIAAAVWSPNAEEALNLNAVVAAAAQATRPVPMAAQSVLYVLDRYLHRRHAEPDWDLRFAEFETLLRGWLAAAPDCRWTAASGRRYKAVFAAAHASFWQRRWGAGGSPIIAELWQRALERDESLAVDLLDDMSILALSRGNAALALSETEPLLRSSWLPPQVRQRALQLLGGVADRDPELLQRCLEGPGENRAALARLVRIEPAEVSAEFLLALDFDDVIILGEPFRATVAKALELAIEVGSFHAFVSGVLRMVANRVTGEPMFAERG